ncbi:MAG: Re/Si-specific NAD(P)(+) transhydrogenase subunit alpha [Alphaproteobacteria bacterium]|nr:Re/Si-specific NAD(P)(+) transhydrogenase subunit alpha [Alphaproteobacteria bacterium]
MPLTISIIKENATNETRIAASPDSVKKLVSLGCTVQIETGAGETAHITDDALKKAGAKIAKTAKDACDKANVLLKVQVGSDDLALLHRGSVAIGIVSPYQNEALIKEAAEKGIDLFAMELVPRITRAQSMDVLSSQSNLAGYKAVLDASEYYGRAFPMMMTAAGTIAPAKAFVMGAGVAGLQAIATAKRLGAVVSATDVRPAAKEQVQSLGGTFVAVEDDEFKEAETAGGYAKEMSDSYKKKQAKLVEETLAKQDIVITTALIPGRPAPKLITEAMVKSMKPGSVIVDMAVDMGGNCELSEGGKVVTKHGVTIVGHHNTPGRLPTDASNLYAKNLLNLLGLIIDQDTKDIVIDWDDEIIKGIALTKHGELIHPNFGGKANAGEKETVKKTTAKKTVKKATKKSATKKTTKKAAAKKTAAKEA